MEEVFFTVTGADCKVYELCPGGAQKSLCSSNRLEYLALLTSYRLNEFKVQTAAIRRGLGMIVPLQEMSLFTWRELEVMCCGHYFAKEDVPLLKSKTQYSAYSESDEHIQWLWDILANDFTDAQRKDFLIFVWGRSRLPVRAADFDTNFKISSRSGGNEAFPMAHTCFFAIDLPRYTNRASMSDRLATAISMCGVIDGD